MTGRRRQVHDDQVMARLVEQIGPAHLTDRYNPRRRIDGHALGRRTGSYHRPGRRNTEPGRHRWLDCAGLGSRPRGRWM